MSFIFHIWLQDMELKANETDKLIKGMKLKPTDDTIKYDWNTEAHSSHPLELCMVTVDTDQLLIILPGHNYWL